MTTSPVSLAPTASVAPHDLHSLWSAMTPVMNSDFPDSNPAVVGASPALAAGRSQSPRRESEDGYATTADPEDIFLGLSDFSFDPSLKPPEDQAAIAFAVPTAPVSDTASTDHTPPQALFDFGRTPTSTPLPPPPPYMPPFMDPVAFWAALASVPPAGGTVSSTGSDAASPNRSSPVVGGRPKRRRPRDASELIPVDAPIQKRTYFGESQTSRRDFGRPNEPTATPGTAPTSSDPAMSALLARRHKNTIAARESRRRRAEELTQLKADNDRLVAANESIAAELARVRTELAAAHARFSLLFPSV